jgi:xanthine dehydrogenase small subunit
MRSLHFVRRGQPVALANVPPDRTLLDLLRDDLGATGTKEGCGEGDCGACTVVLGEIESVHSGEGVQERIRYRAINACIRLAHSIDGMALWTVEDLAHDPLIETAGAAPAAGLHPAQEAMVQCHGSQCGFCTPGFVMSLFAMYQNRCCQGQAVTRADAVHDLSGNLCRCTGYRPILDAAQAMGDLPVRAVNETKLLQQLKLLALTGKALEPYSTYISPSTEAALLAARAAHPQAQVVAGCTDVGLWVTKQHRQFPQVLDVTRAAELRAIEHGPAELRIGAAVPLADAFGALQRHWPELERFAARFAGLPVRNSGTLGGNVANGSPIGDSMPLLIALRARVELGSVRGTRTLPLENLYTGYRQNVLAADELLLRIHVPLPAPRERLRAYKVSKRFDDDISAVCLVMNIAIEGGEVRAASIGAGGVAATPARARAAEAALVGQPWSEATVQRATAALQAEFAPISDMRASSAYRSAMLAALPQRFWLETQGGAAASLDQLALEDFA